MLSIYSNFAEGFGRDGNREFTQFVSIAKGLVSETRGQLLYALELVTCDPKLGNCVPAKMNKASKRAR
jgi:four helix bundle protein